MMRSVWAGFLFVLSMHAGTIYTAPQLGVAGNIGDPGHDPDAAHSGVALLNFSGTLCTGVAIAPTVVLTAAHCIGGAPGTTSASFTDSGANTGSYGVSGFLIHPSYTGDALSQVDLALVYLTSPLATWVTIYELYNGPDEVGQIYQVAGWGARASNGGLQGSAGAAGGALRVGNNLWDGTLVPFAPYLPPGPLRNDLLVSDFDDGTEPNNSWLVYFPGLGLTNDGVPNEATIGPGDSGSPSFLGGRVAGITSFNATFTAPVTGAFGEFNAMTRVSSHLEWINANAGTSQVPEPGTFGITALALYFTWATKRRSASKS
jgi:hypothetical protein